MHRAAHVHDRLNLVLLPLLGAACVAGLFDAVCPWKVSVAFMAYIVIDFLWVLVQPECVPSLPRVILLHHAATAALLYFPIARPELSIFTCLDGITELNTFCMIARRQLRTHRRLFNALYQVTFVAMRLVLYPALLPVFWHRMSDPRYASWERGAVVGMQAVLVCFNYVMLALALVNWRKKRSSSSSSSTAAPRTAAASSTARSTSAAAQLVSRLISGFRSYAQPPATKSSAASPYKLSALSGRPTINLRARG